MSVVDFSKEKKIEFKARVNEESIPIVLTFKNEDASPFDISGLDFKFIVSQQPNSGVLFTLSEGDGLEVIGGDDNQLQIVISDTRATQRPNFYFAKLYSADEDHTWISSPFEFYERPHDSEDQDQTITITENGTPIEVTIIAQGGESQSAATQNEANAGSSTSTFINPSTLKNLDSDSVALTDAATIDLTGPKHTLTTATSRTFTNSFVGDFIEIDIILNATDETFTFPAGYLCSFAGTASGDNTLPITGATSGDLISVAIKKNGSQYLVAAANFGQ